jgi:hypothetical protein
MVIPLSSLPYVGEERQAEVSSWRDMLWVWNINTFVKRCYVIYGGKQWFYLKHSFCKVELCCKIGFICSKSNCYKWRLVLVNLLLYFFIWGHRLLMQGSVVFMTVRRILNFLYTEKSDLERMFNQDWFKDCMGTLYMCSVTEKCCK